MLQHAFRSQIRSQNLNRTSKAQHDHEHHGGGLRALGTLPLHVSIRGIPSGKDPANGICQHQTDTNLLHLTHQGQQQKNLDFSGNPGGHWKDHRVHNIGTYRFCNQPHSTNRGQETDDHSKPPQHPPLH